MCIEQLKNIFKKIYIPVTIYKGWFNNKILTKRNF